jgi:hypothetical protein
LKAGIVQNCASVVSDHGREPNGRMPFCGPSFSPECNPAKADFRSNGGLLSEFQSRPIRAATVPLATEAVGTRALQLCAQYANSGQMEQTAIGHTS